MREWEKDTDVEDENVRELESDMLTVLEPESEHEDDIDGVDVKEQEEDVEGERE